MRTLSRLQQEMQFFVLGFCWLCWGSLRVVVFLLRLFGIYSDNIFVGETHSTGQFFVLIVFFLTHK